MIVINVSNMRKNVSNAVNSVIKSLNRQIEFNVVELICDIKISLIDLELNS